MDEQLVKLKVEAEKLAERGGPDRISPKMYLEPQLVLEMIARIQIFESIQRLDLKPGDTLVIRFSTPIPSAERNHLKQRLTELFPQNRFLILGEGAELSILNEAESRPG